MVLYVIVIATIETNRIGIRVNASMETKIFLRIEIFRNRVIAQITSASFAII